MQLDKHFVCFCKMLIKSMAVPLPALLHPTHSVAVSPLTSPWQCPPPPEKSLAFLPEISSFCIHFWLAGSSNLLFHGCSSSSLMGKSLLQGFFLEPHFPLSSSPPTSRFCFGCKFPLDQHALG